MSKYKTFTAEVDVDLDEFDNDDIVDEVIRRANPKCFNSFTKDDCRRIIKGLSMSPQQEQRHKMVDTIKLELFNDYIDRFSVEDFEDFLRDKGIILKSSAAYSLAQK